MPYVVFPIQTITNGNLRNRISILTWYDIEVYYTLWEAVHMAIGLRPPSEKYAQSGYTYTKPETVPEGHALKFFPTSIELAKIAGCEAERGGLPPWALTDPDEAGRIPEWAGLMQRVFYPRITPDGQLSYYPSPMHAWENRPEVVTIGRFLHTAWDVLDRAYDNYMTNNAGELTDERIRELSAMPTPRTTADVEFITDGDAIVSAYANGPNSCMAHDVDKYDTAGQHPVKVYGAGDLALAVMRKRRDPTKFAQRALVWPKKKVWSRIYGTGPLEQLLTALGYSAGTLHGAKLLRIPLRRTKNGHDVLLMPYIDYQHYVVDCGDYLRIHTKKVKHPLNPEIEMIKKPNKKYAAWTATFGTSGQILVPGKCKCCERQIDMQSVDAYGRNTEYCSTCATKRLISCGACGKTIMSGTDPNGVLFVDNGSLEDGQKPHRRNTQYICGGCASPQRIASYSRGRTRIPTTLVYKAPHAKPAHTHEDAPVQTADGVENRA